MLINRLRNNVQDADEICSCLAKLNKIICGLSKITYNHPEAEEVIRGWKITFLSKQVLECCLYVRKAKLEIKKKIKEFLNERNYLPDDVTKLLDFNNKKSENLLENMSSIQSSVKSVLGEESGYCDKTLLNCEEMSDLLYKIYVCRLYLNYNKRQEWKFKLDEIKIFCEKILKDGETKIEKEINELQDLSLQLTFQDFLEDVLIIQKEKINRDRSKILVLDPSSYYNQICLICFERNVTDYVVHLDNPENCRHQICQKCKEKVKDDKCPSCISRINGFKRIIK